VNNIKLISIFMILLIVLLPVSFSLSITNVEYSNITDRSAIIKWRTDEASNSSVHYGNSTNLTLSKDVSESVLNHSVLIDNLLNNTLYYFAVQSGDVINNNSGNFYSFTTQQTIVNIPLFLNVSIPAYVNTGTINIAGTTKPNARVLVYLNNNLERAYLTPDGTFDFVSVDIIDNQVNSIVVKAIDTDNTNITKSFTVISDTIAPIINISTINSLVSSRNITVSGTSSEESLITVLVNGTAVYNVTGTTFSTTVNIAEGTNTIGVRAVDRAGNFDYKEVSVVADTTPPTFSNIDPPTGTAIYDTWAKSATIKGKTEAGAQVRLFVKKDYESDIDKTTNADSEGNFEFKRVDLFSNFRFSGNLDNDTHVDPASQGTALGKVNVSLTSKDAVGLMAHSNLTYTIINCWGGGEFLFHITYLPETTFPTMLNPDRLADGSEQISFWVDVNYTGSGVSRINDLSLTSLCGNSYIRNNAQYNLSCRLLPNTYTVRIHNEDYTKWYFVYKLNKLTGTENYTKLDWENFYKSISNKVPFPFRATLTFTLENSNQTIQTQCFEVPYTLDNSKIDPRDVLPHWLMYDMVTNLENAIKYLNNIDTKLRSVTKYVGASCIASFLGFTAVKLIRIISCKVGEWTIKTGAKTEACTGDFKENVPSQNKMNNDQLKDCHAGCHSLWQSEAWLYKSMRLTCDRLWGHTTPAGWTSEKSDEDILIAKEKGEVCGSENLGKGIVLQEEKNCKVEGEREVLPICYKYKAEGKELYYEKVDQTENLNGLTIATLNCKGTECKKIPSSQSFTVYQKLYAVKESNKYLAALPYDCSYMCTKKYSYSSGKVQTLVDGKCLDNNNNKQGIPFGYTKDAWDGNNINLNKVCCCYDARVVESINQNYYSQDQVNSLADTPLIDEKNIWGNWDYRYATLGTSYQPEGNNAIGGKKYNPNRYYKGRDWTACFGMDSISDYIKRGDPEVVMIYPSKNLISSIQCLALGPIVARIAQIKNILTALKNCLISVRTTGTANTAVCKEIFSRYVCQSISDIIVAATKGCGTSMTGKLVGNMDEEGNYVGLVFGSIGQAIDESSQVLTEEYDGSKIGNLIGTGVDQISNKICMAAFGYDWDLSLQGVLDASYQAPYETIVISQPNRREMVGINPDTGIANYAYRVVWGISPGCDLSGARIDLACVTRKELNEKAGISCNGPIDENMGCDCLDLAQEQTKPFASEGTISQGQFKEGGMSAVIPTKYRYDHVKITLIPKDRTIKEKCMPEDNKDGVFYFPIPDKTGRQVGCRADYTTGTFYCNMTAGAWNARGTAQFLNIKLNGQTISDNMEVYQGNPIRIEVEVENQNPGKCLVVALKGPTGIIETQSVTDINFDGQHIYDVPQINARINGAPQMFYTMPGLGLEWAGTGSLQSEVDLVIEVIDIGEDGIDYKADNDKDKIKIDGTEKTIKQWFDMIQGILFKDGEKLVINKDGAKVRIIALPSTIKENEGISHTRVEIKPASSGRETKTLEFSLNYLAEGKTDCIGEGNYETGDTGIVKKAGVPQKKVYNIVLKGETSTICTQDAINTQDCKCRNSTGTVIETCTIGGTTPLPYCKKEDGKCYANECEAKGGSCKNRCDNSQIILSNLKNSMGCTQGQSCCKNI